MALLEEIVSHLSPDECRRFRAFAGADLAKSKAMRLFEELRKSAELPRAVLMKKLYGKQIKRNAYDNVRKRLIERIVDFVVLDQASVVQEPRAQVLRLMSAAYKFRADLAWSAVRHFCLKAEEMALQYRMYSILEGIYDFMMQHATAYELDLPLEEVAARQKANAPKAARIRALNEAATQMELDLHRAKKAGETLVPEVIFEQVSSRFQLTVEEKNNPSFRMRIVRIFRSTLLSAKKYGEVKSLLLNAYDDLSKAGAFGDKYSEEEYSLVYMVAHALYRNRNFADVPAWLDRMGKHMSSKNWITNPLYLKAQALRAAVHVYTGQNEEAIALLTELRRQRPAQHHMKEWLNIDLSLSVYHFNAKNYRKTISVLNQIQQPGVKLSDWMGVEWCFKMEMIGLIAHFEQGNEDLAIQRHKRISKVFKTMLRHEKYTNAAMFFKIIGKLIRNPHVVTKPGFRTQIKGIIQNWEYDIGDLQAVTFFCWLKSKLHGKDYYDLLLEEVSA